MDACPLSGSSSHTQQQAIDAMLKMPHIAIVGLSPDPARPSHRIASYLLSRGKIVIPVNPKITQVLAQHAYPTLAEIPTTVDVVNIFRRAEACPQIVEQAIAIGAKGVWLQSGIRSPKSEALARDARILFVQDRCIMVEHLAKREPEEG